ncbi:MAG: type VII secretion protein EccE, partial [Actinocatenispora sp.]
RLALADRPAGERVDPRRVALRELAPELTVVDSAERGGTFGLGYDGTGWFAAVAVAPTDNPVPLRRLAEIVKDGAQVSRLQLVCHTSQAPVARLNAWAPAAVSYQEVSAKLTGPVPPGDSRTFLVARLDATDAVEVAGDRGGGLTGVQRALGAAIQRIGRTLSGAGIGYRMLDADELLGAQASMLGIGAVGLAGAGGPGAGSAGVVGPGGGGPVGQPSTDAQWDRFLAGGYAQVSFQVTGWPPVGERFAACLDNLPVAWTSLSLLLGPASDRTTDDEVPLRGYLRIAAAPDALGPACAELAKAAGLQGMTLHRLDGEQGPAVYATLPTGGQEDVGTAGHACPVDALDQLAPPVRHGGVLLGRDPDHRPVLVSVFRERPVRLVLVGGIWPTRLVLLRSLAVGARAVAATGQPDWVSLGRWATGADHWVLPPGAGVPPGHPAAPVLVSVDPVGGTPPPAAGWQTVVTVCPRPSERLLGGADLLITGKLLPADAELVAGRFGLSGDGVRLLSRMYDDMAAVIEPGSIRFCWPTPSTVEREVLTPPRQSQPALGAPPR